jgi:glutamyl-tRNA reductase
VRFAVIGLSHRTASIELRERFAHHTRDLAKALEAVQELETVDEACIVSTCNRVEFYVAGGAEPKTLSRALRSHLLALSGLPPAELDPHLYVHEGERGLHHLFRVASSLDSMVVGEPQILGQVKEAYRSASETKHAGAALTRAFSKAFYIAKRVRTETGVAENAVSMSFAAVELGKEIFDTLEGKQVLLIGAGKMAGLASKHLMSSGVQQVRVASRSMESAQRLANEIGGLASSLSDLPILLNEADIVISSTAAPGYVVDKKMMAKVVRKRRYRPILFVDIAVPRDVDPDVADLDNVFVYDVDDLEQVLELNRESRAREAAAAEALIDEELAGYVRWSKSQQVVPIIKALRTHAMRVAAAEVDRTTSNVKNADKRTLQSIKAMSNAIVNKMLHPVMTALKEEGASGDPQPMIDALVRLFDLEEAVRAAEAPPEPKAEAADNVVELRPKDQAHGDGSSS